MADHDSAQEELLAADTTHRHLVAELAAAEKQIASGNYASVQAGTSETTKPLADWTIAEVGMLLADLGLDTHAKRFAEQEMDGLALVAVERDNLAELGMDGEEQQTLLAAVHGRSGVVGATALRGACRDKEIEAIPPLGATEQAETTQIDKLLGNLFSSAFFATVRLLPPLPLYV